MSVYFESSGYFDLSVLVNSSVGNTKITDSAINRSSIDMNMQNITSVKDPIDSQDAATKKYVDDLGIVISQVSLSGVTETQISSANRGSFVITVNNLEQGGPSGIFHVTKNEANNYAHIVRTVATPGISISPVTLMIKWPPTSGILLYKSGNAYNGNYRVKIM
jgi:hypothetical protein